MSTRERPSPSRTASRLLAISLAFSLLVAVLTPIPRIPDANAAAVPVFRIYGAGWGHGVGLSQYGAKGWAEHGKPWDWIATYYFPGSKLSTVPPSPVTVNLDANRGPRRAWKIAPPSGSAKLKVGSHWGWQGQAFYVTRSPGALQVKTLDGKIVTTASGTLSAGSNRGLVRVLSSTGKYGRSGVVYRGKVKFSKAGSLVKAVNVVGLEGYVMGVLPGEVNASWPLDALKAQAVAARSYALATGGELYPTDKSQMYMGYSAESDQVRRAVSETRGRVLTYDGRVIQAFFSSSHGGHSVDIEQAWPRTALPSTTHPYYRGVPDPYAGTAGSPNDPWPPVTVSGYSVARVFGWGRGWYASRMSFETKNGHVATVLATITNGRSSYQRALPGLLFKARLGLKSTAFSLKPMPDPAALYEAAVAKRKAQALAKAALGAAESSGSVTASGSIDASGIPDAVARLLDPDFRWAVLKQMNEQRSPAGRLVMPLALPSRRLG